MTTSLRLIISRRWTIKFCWRIYKTKACVNLSSLKTSCWIQFKLEMGLNLGMKRQRLVQVYFLIQTKVKCLSINIVSLSSRIVLWAVFRMRVKTHWLNKASVNQGMLILKIRCYMMKVQSVHSLYQKSNNFV